MNAVIIHPKLYKWIPKFTKAALELNHVLAEAAKDGVKPVILIHADDELLGERVQVIEVSMALGTIDDQWIEG